MTNWEQIVKKHAPLVWQTAYRLLSNEADAADCFSETFVSALEISRRQRVRNFPALLARLATARAIDQLRRRYAKSQIRTNTEDLAAIPSANPGPAQQAQSKELQTRLRKALTKLPQKQAQAFCLRYLNDMSYVQIAKTLDITISTTGVLLLRAKTKLKQLLETAASEENL
ncbi:MAG: sigma-70 family RNA polymerase sigma factor [Planctomycetes bacterium]|nr:sigma-70 family RNA polymerase sigma factor [Planctomycetota bacterium]